MIDYLATAAKALLYKTNSSSICFTVHWKQHNTLTTTCIIHFWKVEYYHVPVPKVELVLQQKFSCKHSREN